MIRAGVFIGGLAIVLPHAAGKMARLFLDGLNGGMPGVVWIGLLGILIAAFWPEKKGAAQ